MERVVRSTIEQGTRSTIEQGTRSTIEQGTRSTIKSEVHHTIKPVTQGQRMFPGVVQRPGRRLGERGLSMIECVFAMYLLALCVGIILDLFPSVGARTARQTTLRTRATFLAQAKMEELLLFGAGAKREVRGTFRGEDQVFAYRGTLLPWYRDEKVQLVSVEVYKTGAPDQPLIHLSSLRVPTSTTLMEDLDTTDDDGAWTPTNMPTSEPGTQTLAPGGFGQPPPAPASEQDSQGLPSGAASPALPDTASPAPAPPDAASPAPALPSQGSSEGGVP